MLLIYREMNFEISGLEMGLNYNDYKEFLELFLAKIESHFAPARIMSVALFGSVSRGEANRFSDIDLLIVHGNTTCDPIKKLVDVLLEIRKDETYQSLNEKGLYPEPSCIFMTPEELSKRPLILLDIMDHGILLKDMDRFLAGTMRILREKLDRMGAYKIVLKDGRWAWDLKPDLRIGEVFEITL